MDGVPFCEISTVPLFDLPNLMRSPWQQVDPPTGQPAGLIWSRRATSRSDQLVSPDTPTDDITTRRRETY